jgi:hypothetical protein
MMDNRRRIIFGAELGLPKVFVGRFEPEIQVKAITENKYYLS